MKRLLAILLCGMLMFTMCACGSGGSDEPEPSGEPAAEQEVEVDPATEEDVPDLEEMEAIRLATDYALETAIEEQEEGMVLEIDDAEILDQNADAYLVSIPCLEYYEGEAAGGYVNIYRVDKKSGNVKFITGAQDYWDGMIDITKGEVNETEESAK